MIEESHRLLLTAALGEPNEAASAWDLYSSKYDLQKVAGEELALFPLVCRNLKQHDSASFMLCKSKYRHTWCANHLLWENHRPTLNETIVGEAALVLRVYRDFGVRMMGEIATKLENDQATLLPEIGLHVAESTDLLFHTCTKALTLSLLSICDAMTLLKEAIVWDRLIALAQRAGLSHRLYSALRFLFREMNAPIPRSVLSQLRFYPLERLEHFFLTQKRFRLARLCRRIHF